MEIEIRMFISSIVLVSANISGQWQESFDGQEVHHVQFICKGKLVEEYSVREEKSNIKMLVRKRASFRSSPKGRASPGTHVRVLRSRAVQLREPGAQAG